MKPLLSDYVKIYKDFLSKDLCEKTVSSIQKNNWTKHSYTNRALTKFNSPDNDLSILSNDYNECSIEIMQKLWYGIRSYLTDINLGWHQSWEGFSHLRYNKYDPETEMRFHCDHITELFDGNRKGIPVLTLLGLLNDDFKGGELVLFDENNPVNISGGDLIIFPSNFLYPHAIKPIQSGIRYSFVSWTW